MNGGSEEHEEAELFAHLEPVVEPAREPGVLGAAGELQPGGQHPGQVAEGEREEGVDRQRLVHVVHGDVIPEMP